MLYPDRRLTPRQRAALEAYRAALRKRRYTPANAKGYTNLFRRFLVQLHPLAPEDLTAAEVEAYAEGYARENGLNPAVKNKVAQALLLYHAAVLGLATGNVSASPSDALRR
ncbi:MAG TPA: phage integrase N-terminal SAM-like domain-containing protein [Chitinophagales bacterium]|nr:phage integrase N-terminal SAM-like domain-containing protein [Chitinophagales bacterium]